MHNNSIDFHSNINTSQRNNYIILGAVILKLIPTILLRLQNSGVALKILKRMRSPKHLFWHCQLKIPNKAAESILCNIYNIYVTDVVRWDVLPSVMAATIERRHVIHCSS